MTTFVEFLRERFSDRWVVAPRLTARLKQRGYTVAITSPQYRQLEREWERGHYGAPLESLQAAAPALLVALKRTTARLEAVLRFHDPEQPELAFDSHPDLNLARAIIAQAEGR